MSAEEYKQHINRMIEDMDNEKELRQLFIIIHYKYEERHLHEKADPHHSR